jgi:thymidylate synthase (FAD)
VITANFREWRHIIQLRGEPAAQWEIRRLAVEVLRILQEKAPATFGDFDVDDKDFIVSRRDSAGGSENE